MNEVFSTLRSNAVHVAKKPSNSCQQSRNTLVKRMLETPAVLSSLIGSKHLNPQTSCKEAAGKRTAVRGAWCHSPELFLQWRMCYGKFCLTASCNFITVSCISIHKLQDTLKVSIITKTGTRVLMEQFALRSSEAKFVGENAFNYAMDVIRKGEQTVRHTSPFRFEKKRQYSG